MFAFDRVEKIAMGANDHEKTRPPFLRYPVVRSLGLIYCIILLKYLHVFIFYNKFVFNFVETNNKAKFNFISILRRYNIAVRK